MATPTPPLGGAKVPYLYDNNKLTQNIPASNPLG